MDCEIFSEVIHSHFLTTKNRTKPQSSGLKEMSAIKTVLFVGKRKITESNGSFGEGPECNQSFNESPSIFELASNKIRTND